MRRSESPGNPIELHRLASGMLICVTLSDSMLNVFQLMTAFWLVWLTTTYAVPWPCTDAEPATTDAPLGPADAEMVVAGKIAEVMRTWSPAVHPPP